MKRRGGLHLARTTGLLLGIAAIFADFLSPNPPAKQNLEAFFAPPTPLRFVDASGKLHARPFVYRRDLVDPLNASYAERRDLPAAVEFLAQGWEYSFLGLRCSRHLILTPHQDAFYPLGTDELGRDVLARTLAGARISVIVMLVGISLCGILGLGVGAVAGLARGWVDLVLMRASEFVLALPALYLILALRTLLPPEISWDQTLLIVVAVISLVAWPPMARAVRGIMLQLGHASHIEAARALGGSEWFVFRRHLLPALAPVAMAHAVLLAPVFLLGEVLLSFLGVGFQDASGSWGTMLQKVGDLRVVTDFWWNLAPLPLVALTLLALDAVRVAQRQWSGATPRL